MRKRSNSPPTQCFSGINTRKIHNERARRVGRTTVPQRLLPCSVKPLVPLLSLLENHSSHHSTHHDAQQRAQQQQEDLPAGERRSPEVPGGVIDVVCEPRRVDSNE